LFDGILEYCKQPFYVLRFVTNDNDNDNKSGGIMLMTLERNPGNQENPDEELLTPAEAAAYLAKRWGRKSFSVEGFRTLRIRIGLVPAKQTSRLTLYRRSQLDGIEEPINRGRPPKNP
jgi:hypothetical protein